MEKKISVYIKSLKTAVPEKRVSNDELAQTVDTSDEWIYSHTGIRYRHIADKDTAASDLALGPCREALKEAGVAAEDLDLILLASTTPDYYGFPSTACILQDKLGAHNAGALDITAACTGFIYGLETAKNYIQNGSAKNVLVVAVELLTKITNWEDRNTCVLFGDGAGAAVLTVNTENDKSDFLKSTLRSQGSGAPHLIKKTGGSRFPFSAGESITDDCYLFMDGRKVYNFAVKALCDTVNWLLENNNVDMEQVKYIVPHQANTRIIQAAAGRLKIPVDKFFMNIEEFANTSAASIPLALNELIEKQMISRGDIIMTIGFGGGLTYGGNLIIW